MCVHVLQYIHVNTYRQHLIYLILYAFITECNVLKSLYVYVSLIYSSKKS